MASPAPDIAIGCRPNDARGSNVKLRNLILIALGIFIGYKLAAKMREDDPSVVKGPQRRQEGFGSEPSRADGLLAGAADRRAGDQQEPRHHQARAGIAARPDG